MNDRQITVVPLPPHPPAPDCAQSAAGPFSHVILLGNTTPIPVDGLCVRIGAMRCHSLALTVKMTHAVPVSEIETLIRTSNPWVRWVPNDRKTTVHELTPAAITGTLHIGVGRVRHMNMGPEFISAFVIDDQLLWGAAEPLHRMLRIILKHHN